MLSHHPEHQPVAEHASLTEHTPHCDAAERGELLAQELGKAVAGNHPQSSESLTEKKAAEPDRTVKTIQEKTGFQNKESGSMGDFDLRSMMANDSVDTTESAITARIPLLLQPNSRASISAAIDRARGNRLRGTDLNR